MTKRDSLWRVSGAMLFFGGCFAAASSDRGPLTIALFLIVLAGLTIMINGKRVGVVLQAERRGHGNTAIIIRAERNRRRRRSTD